MRWGSRRCGAACEGDGAAKGAGDDGPLPAPPPGGICSESPEPTPEPEPPASRASCCPNDDEGTKPVTCGLSGAGGGGEGVAAPP